MWHERSMRQVCTLLPGTQQQPKARRKQACVLALVDFGLPME